MKIAIISDCHFGFNEDALPQAREAMLLSLKMGADAILLPGDIYDIRVPRQEVLHETIRLYSEIKKRGARGPSAIQVLEKKGEGFQKIENEGIPILAIWGTHERRGKGLTNVIQIMDAAGLLICFHTRTLILEKGTEKVAFQGLGGVPEEYFGRTLEVAGFAPLKGVFNIFVFHQNLSELMPVEMENTVSMEDLPNGFQLYVNGHIHWNHDIKSAGRRLLVSGSTVVTQMKKNEEKPKGFYLFDTSSQVAEFVEIPSRPFHFREIRCASETAAGIESAIEGELAQILAKHSVMLPLVKIKLSGTVPRAAAAAIDIDKIIRKNAGRAILYIDKDFESAELKDRIEMLRRIRAEGKGAKDLGWEILRVRLKEKRIGIREPHEFFEMLAEGEVERALAHI